MDVSELDRNSQIVSYLQEHESAGASELAAFLGVGTSYTRKLLRKLVGSGVVVKVGDNRFARYELRKDHGAASSGT